MPDLELRELGDPDRSVYFRGVQSIWGGGLDEGQFVLYQQRLCRSAEAQGRYRVLGLYGPGGGPLSALKAYTLYAPGGTRVLGIGAVFTEPGLRRHGHAAELLRRVLDESTRAGFSAALLFSDIGADYYGRLGFVPLESDECLVDLHQLPRGGVFRSAAPGDEAAIDQVLARSRTGGAHGLLRDGWAVRFQLRRLRELARARAVAEPEWGVCASGSGLLGGEAAALLRHTRDAVDVLDAGWTSPGARDALFAGLRSCLVRSGRSRLRLWPAHQLRGLFPARPRDTALAMWKVLAAQAAPPAPGAAAELTLLDHI